MGKSSVSDLSEHVFDLIQELFAIDPMLLTSVMPQLEFKLKVNTTHTLPQSGTVHLTSDHLTGIVSILTLPLTLSVSVLRVDWVL